MSLALAIGVAALLQGQPSASKIVRQNLAVMELAAERSPYFRNELDLLPQSYATAIAGQLPNIRHELVLGRAADWLAGHHVISAIPILIRSLEWKLLLSPDVPSPSVWGALKRYGADAVPALIQGYRSGPEVERRVCAELLTDPEILISADRRIEKITIGMTADPDPELRKTALRAFGRMVFDVHSDYMDCIHYTAIRRPDLVRYVIDLVWDRDFEVSSDARSWLVGLLKLADNSIPSPGGGMSDGELRDIQPKVRPLAKSKQAEIRAAAVAMEDLSQGLDQLRFDALSDPDPTVFHAAIVCSRVSIRQAWIPKLIELAKSPTVQLRRAAALLLAGCFDPKAELALDGLALDADPAVREAAKTKNWIVP